MAREGWVGCMSGGILSGISRGGFCWGSHACAWQQWQIARYKQKYNEANITNTYHHKVQAITQLAAAPVVLDGNGRTKKSKKQKIPCMLEDTTLNRTRLKTLSRLVLPRFALSISRHTTGTRVPGAVIRLVDVWKLHCERCQRNAVVIQCAND